MITVVGSVNMDLVARVPCLPAPGQTVLATSFMRSPGGKGANQAVAAARAGSDVRFVGRVGDDAQGADLLQSLRAADVNTAHTIVDPRAPSGTALISVDDGGENEIVVVPGSNGRVSLDDVDAARDTIATGTVLVLQLEIPLETVEHAARVARAAGALVLLNPAPAQPLDPSLMHTVDVLVANEIEVAALSGMGAPVEPASAARLLVGAGIQSVVVTLGSRGAVLVTNDGETDIPAFRVEAVDTTGAGDCFVGALAHALDAGRPLDGAIRFATGAAALSVQRRGAQPSMPTKAEIDAFLTSMVES